MRSLAILAAGLLATSPATMSKAWAAEGMPQLDFANPLTVAQIVWLGLIFLALYLLLSYWALPQVASVLEQRAAMIERDLDMARHSKAQADEAVAELTRATREAQMGAQASIASAVDAAKSEAASRAGVLNARLDEQLREAEQRIATARAGSVGALRSVAHETAHVLYFNMAGQPANDDAVGREVDAAIAARGQG